MTLIAGLETTKGGTSLRRPSGNQALMWEVYENTDLVSSGRIPAGSVVVSGTLPSGDGKCQLYCAVIVKRVDATTRAKTSINELLRGD